jgi:hypothetical protein
MVEQSAIGYNHFGPFVEFVKEFEHRNLAKFKQFAGRVVPN